MAKTLFGVEQRHVQPEWKMRSYAWLDTTTLKPKYSVQARDPAIDGWAHIYNGEAREIVFFPSEQEAHGYIRQLQARSAEGNRSPIDGNQSEKK